MFLSYFIVLPIDFYFRIHASYNVYYPNSLYLILDILTVLVLVNFCKASSYRDSVCRYYLIICLLLNSLLFLLAQIDTLLIYNNYKPGGAWRFWNVFSIGVNIFDLIMVLVLVIQKDFLGWYKLTEKVKGALLRPA